MKNKAVSGIMLILLLTSMSTLAFNIKPVRASGTVYIRADGSIEGTTHISTVDNITYTFTDNIYDRIVVWRDNIVVDGAGYAVQGVGTGNGIYLAGSNNVTIKNLEIRAFQWGILLSSSINSNISRNNVKNNYYGIGIIGHSSYNNISANTITNNYFGIHLNQASNNSIYTNNIANNGWVGIGCFYFSYNNNISRNNVTANISYGIRIGESTNNTISENTIANNERGIAILWGPNNSVYRNNFINNTFQAYTQSSVNVWDDEYPSGGNYWSDHVTVDDYSGVNQDELGSDGIVDEPYIIDENNQDNYPLVKPWSHVISATVDIYPDALNLRGGGKWITAYIQLPKEYNAEDIDATTILLNGTIPPVLDPRYDFVTNSSEYLVDHDEDGILERMVKFDKAEVTALLSVGEATLTITGEVNGTPFEGSDSIRVISPSTGSGGCKGFKK